VDRGGVKILDIDLLSSLVSAASLDVFNTILKSHPKQSYSQVMSGALFLSCSLLCCVLEA